MERDPKLEGKTPTEVVVEKPLMALLSKYKTQIESTLPRQLDSKRVLKLIVGAINKNPDLLKCTPMSVVNAVLTAAALGLEIRPNMAYLLPFKKSVKTPGGWQAFMECQLVIDYRGKIDLVCRTGRVLDVDLDIVYSKDKFRIYRDDNGLKRIEHEPVYFKIGPEGEHLPIEEGDRGIPIGALAVAAIRDGAPKVLFMPKADIMKIREKSKAKSSGPWKHATSGDDDSPVNDNDELEMWKKTACHRICKTLPQSPEAAIANQLEDASESGVRFDILELEAGDATSTEALLPEGSRVAQEAVLAKKLEAIEQQKTNGAHISSPGTDGLPANREERAPEDRRPVEMPIAAKPTLPVTYKEWPDNPPIDVPFTVDGDTYRYDEAAGNFRQVAPVSTAAPAESASGGAAPRQKPVFGGRGRTQ